MTLKSPNPGELVTIETKDELRVRSKDVKSNVEQC